MSSSLLQKPPLAASVPERAAGARWVSIPRRGDPRIPFACILTLYVTMGIGWLGFNRSPTQIAAIVVAACVLDMVLHLLIQRAWLFPLSAYITGLSLALLLNYAHDHLVLLLPVFLAISSKYVFTYKGGHVYNPSLFGVVGSLLIAGDLITTAPAYQWGGTWAMSAFMVMAALSLFIFKVGRGWLVGSFLIFYALQTALRAYVMRAHLPPEMLFLGTISTPPFFLFTFFMITDPKTSPPSRRGQIGVAAAITLVDLYLHTLGSVFTFFYAAAAVATARFVWMHTRDLVARGPVRYLRETLLSSTKLRVIGIVVVFALLGGVTYARVRPHVALTDAGFTLHELSPDRTGIEIVMDPDTYELVDHRLQHISKWLLSVGASVSAADVTGDGAVDLFFTSPLARAADRSVLYVNVGGFRFRRLAIPVLDALNADPRAHGIATGSLLFDHDSDGDRDILVLVSFGDTRLLKNMTTETGRTWFRDVSAASGVRRYTISVAANVLDHDSDGDQDLLIGQVLPTHLPGYDPPEKLNIFHLPEPTHEGDRRMFHFMHDGWHDADNGGRNILLENRGGGTFDEVPAGDVGMPETHWSLAIGTGDLNSDHATDVYVANDFGPDDLYINDGGRFHRLSGRFFGEIGKDTYKGMNASIADVDADGRLDVYVSNVHHALQAEGSLLWMNRGRDDHGDPILRDQASTLGALNEDRFGWGASIGDLNNDGWLDIVQANGMVDDRLDDHHRGCPDYWYVNHKLMQSGPEIHTYADQWGDLRGRCIFPNEKRRVYLNRGAGARPQFVDVAELVGLTAGDNSRGVALADLDDDGRLDVVIANQHGPPTVLRSRATSQERASWIGVELVGDGVACGTGAEGSTVAVERAGGPPLIAEAQTGTGFSAQDDPRMHFGLGAESPRNVAVSVRWCGGDRVEYRLRPNAYHRLVMGSAERGGAP
ncbi:MAG: CRTAC1 family protein [Actinomycetota bacterium]|nr:CRTAC1 family protein [Actinomycetota bacterium]